MEAEDDQPEIYSKINDYTLSVVVDFTRQAQADPELRRIFNFKSRQITTIYSMWYRDGLTSNMETQNFSALDSIRAFCPASPQARFAGAKKFLKIILNQAFPPPATLTLRQAACNVKENDA